jgi:hypothetical protein
MRKEGRTQGRHAPVSTRHLALILGGSAALGALILMTPGCATRESRPVAAADSTLVYPARHPGDVDAGISFSLRDSQKRDEAAKRDRELSRDLARRKKGLERDLRKEQDPVLEAQLRAIDDSLALMEAQKSQRLQGAGQDERDFDLEEGAKVQATFNLTHPRARGDRPLAFHVLWVDPASKAAFRKAVAFAPVDSAGKERTSFSSSFGISPAKRAAGSYSVRLYLFRELIAEKRFRLRGAGLAPAELDEGKGQM